MKVPPVLPPNQVLVGNPQTVNDLEQRIRLDVLLFLFDETAKRFARDCLEMQRSPPREILEASIRAHVDLRLDHLLPLHVSVQQAGP